MNIIGGARWNFNPRSPHGERRKSPKMKLPGTNFNPRSPHGERPAAVCCLCRWRYFNPRSPHGERPGWSILSAIISVFQSTLPARGATFNQSPFAVHASFQSTLPARGATRRHRRHIATYTISIHAPRTGSDGADVRRGGQGQHFNPRSPHGERPLTQAIPRRMQRDFNPRSPHGERLRLGGRRGGGGHFNPRSPHGERLRGRDAPTRAVVISIHAPRTGSDGQPRKQMHRACIFQSTLPARGATARCFALSVIQSNFNPRSPHGERRR